jgi:hypothetical protein
VREGVLKGGMFCLASSLNVRSFSDSSLVASGDLFHAGVVSSLGKLLHVLWGSDPVKRKEYGLKALAVTL